MSTDYLKRTSTSEVDTMTPLGTLTSKANYFEKVDKDRRVRALQLNGPKTSLTWCHPLSALSEREHAGEGSESRSVDRAIDDPVLGVRISEPRMKVRMRYVRTNGSVSLPSPACSRSEKRIEGWHQ